MDNLVYVIEEPAHGHAAVVDPAWDADAIAGLIDERELLLTDILVTHGHDDHVNALEALLARYRASVHISAREADFRGAATAGTLEVGPPPDRCSEVWSAPPPSSLALHSEETLFEVGDLHIEMLMTPGHSPGGCCYRLGNDLFTGDTLFVYGCGRCDLAGSDPSAMFLSLRMLNRRIPDSVVVRPGHRYAAQASTTMAEQRRGNPFLHIEDQDAFIAFRAEHNRHRLPPYSAVPRGAPVW
jgi:glyoxylase-like metal-dependent hydrolase (beta-lactamase superfamily II)